VASTGDYGTADPEYPAFSPNVVAVGGTSLYLNGDSSYNSETGWGYYSNSAGTLIGSGGGTSLYEPEPTYQAGVQSTGARSTPDVSFVADPGTGAWVSDPYNLPGDSSFEVVGGTSLSSPCWAGVFALANQGRADAGQPTLNTTTPTDAQQALYSLPQADFNSITSGSNGGYTAAAGYNMVTGLGTPVANRLVPDLAAYQQSGDVNTTTPISVTSASSSDTAAAGAANALGVANVFNALTVTGDGSAEAPVTAVSYVGVYTAQVAWTDPLAPLPAAGTDATEHHTPSAVAARPALNPAALDALFGSAGLFQSASNGGGNDGNRSVSLAEYYAEGPRSLPAASGISGESGGWARLGSDATQGTSVASEGLARSSVDAFFGDLGADVASGVASDVGSGATQSGTDE
jgi:hypothetical protein